MAKKKEIPATPSRGTEPVLERVRALGDSQLHAVLATEGDGKPYVSLMAFALTPDLTGLVFATPRGTRKYKNIVRNKNVSLLIDTRTNTGKDYLGAEALTVIGHAQPLRRGKRHDELAALLVKKHPRLKEFVSAPTTALVHVRVERYIHVSTFQTVTTLEMG